jgi:cysteinyl-tRNA synthetase
VPFVRYWAHTGLLSLAGAEGQPDDGADHNGADHNGADADGADAGRQSVKMAHSGTFVTIRSVLASGDVPAPGLRTYLLGQHYRANVIYSPEQVAASVRRWRRWADTRANLIRLIAWAESHTAPEAPAGERDHALLERLDAARERFVVAMDDDFNTSAAFSAIDDLTHDINDYANGLAGDAARPEEVGALRAASARLDELTGVLGIALATEDVSASDSAEDTARRTEISALLAERDTARTAKDWALADRIRKDLDERFGVVIKDTPQGATWSLKEG